MRNGLLVVVALLGCHEPRKEKTIDAAALREMLHQVDTAREIESIRVEPGDGGRARYVITLRSTNKRTVATAEYPGTLTDDIVAAGIPYMVGDPDGRRDDEKLIDMTRLRVALQCGASEPPCGDARDIARIDIKPLDQGRARYVVQRTSDPIHEVCYGEYPGKVVAEIQHAHVTYEIRP